MKQQSEEIIEGLPNEQPGERLTDLQLDETQAETINAGDGVNRSGEFPWQVSLRTSH